MKLKRVIAGISAAAVVLSAMSFSVSTAEEKPADNVFDNLNQQQITHAMEPGWNLGNQLEAVSGNTPLENLYEFS